MSHVGVVSLGLIGGSVALRLARSGVRVTAWNPSRTPLEQAAQRGITPAESVDELCAAEPDVIVLANPLRAMPAMITQVAAALRPGTVVTDVGSVKAPIVELAREAGLADRFIGAHPMAGKELTGFAAADPALLDGARWALTLTEETPAAAFLRVAHLITGPLGGVVHVTDPRVHDEAVALISHVPHVLATELLNLVARTPVRDLALSLAAGSFRDGTRVAHTDPRRTEAMVVENSTWVAPALRVVIRDLERLAEQLESNAPSAEFFDAADELRARGRDVSQHAAQAEQAERAQPQRELDLGLSGWRALVLESAAAGARVVAADADRNAVTIEG